jgi:hypothetical protein
MKGDQMIIAAPREVELAGLLPEQLSWGDASAMAR